MTKWYNHGCPKCGGDQSLEYEDYEWVRHCLQCGKDVKHLSALWDDFIEPDTKAPLMTKGRIGGYQR